MIEIPLTRGQVALVDDIDADLADMKWYALWLPKTQSYYAARNVDKVNGGKTLMLMHRVVLSRVEQRVLTFKDKCDHIHHLTLDNRRKELRLATNSQNLMNTDKYLTNTSGYKGVSWSKSDKKWRASIGYNNKVYFIGNYGTPEEAHDAYCKRAEELHREFANFGA